jgi:hypothetical protein
MEPAQPVMEQPAIAVTPGEGTFDITPMWERFEQHEKTLAEKPAETVEEKPKQEEKPVEEKPKVESEKPVEVEEKQPKMTENAGRAFAALKAEVKELREQKLPATEKLANEREIALQEAQKRLAEFEGKDISQYEKKIAELEAKFGEAEKFRAIHDVANSDQYRSEILYPAERIGQEVDVLAKMYPEVDANDLKAALQITDQAAQRLKIRELTDGWDQIDVSDLMSAAKQTRQLMNRSQELLDNAEKTKSELRFIEEQEGKKKAEADELAGKASNEAVSKMYLEKVGLLKDNPELTEAVKNATPSKEVSRQYSAAKAEIVLPHALEKVDKLTARVAELEGLLAKKAAAKPNPTSVNAQVAKQEQELPGGYGTDDVHNRWMAFNANRQ